ncbi:MAG: hypothetical protein M0Z51_06495 [Propionibacterium sp.]|nr:hypothetical protein [Propionibacterium sp.]
MIGLGSIGTLGLVIGLLAVIFTMMVRGLGDALLVAAFLGLVLLVLLSKDRHQLSLLSRMAARVAWWSARSGGTHLYRSGPLGRALWGTYQLPGLAAPTRLSEHADSYGRRFALLYTPASATFSIVIGTEPDGAALVDQAQIDLWVADWGHWLANLADEPGVEAASVTLETAPDSGTRLRRQVAANLDPGAPAFARAMLTETVEQYPSGSSTVKAYIAVTFSALRRSPEEMGRELGARIPGLTHTLGSTGAGAARPLCAQELCEMIRVAYDPAVAPLIDQAHAQGETPELSWPDVGPTAHEASWDGYRHDSAYSVTWSMTGAPRGVVQSGVLARLLAPHREIARKRVTLLYRPISPAKAAGLVEADLRAAEFASTATSKPAARDVLAVRAAAATASEEASGAGLVNFGLLVTATVLTRDREPDARAAIDNLAATARLRLRPVYGSQDSAFAAALPLGLILSKHLRVPAEMRGKL